MIAITKKDHPIEWIPVGQISVVWAAAQRALNETTVGSITESLDPDAFGTLLITLPNGAGIYHCIDGQNRREAVERLWGAKEMVPCQIVNVTDPARAADLFSKVNSGRVKPDAISRFAVSVTAGYAVETEINDLFKTLGYRVSNQRAEGTIRAVVACISVHKRLGIATLRDTLLILSSCWGRAPEVTDSQLIRGVSQFLSVYGHQADHRRVVDRISREYTPARLLGAAKALKSLTRGSVADNVTSLIATSYDVGLRKDNQLKKRDEGAI